MNRRNLLNGEELKTFNELNQLHEKLAKGFQKQFDRSLPFADEMFDRWERAKAMGFQEGSSIYDSSYVFGNVKVGENSWIGPFTIIDGSGGLTIGRFCTISAGVHIYTHDNIARTLTGGKAEIDRQPVSIGDFTYVAPNVLITSGVTIGDHCIIGAGSFVNQSIPPYSLAFGTPAKVSGRIVLKKETYEIEYFS